MNPGRILFTAALLMLLTLQWMWHGWLERNLLLAAVLSVPLLLPLPWVLKGSVRAAAATCFIALAYFLHAVTEGVVAPEWRLMAIIESGLTLALYATLILWTAARRQAPNAGGANPR